MEWLLDILEKIWIIGLVGCFGSFVVLQGVDKDSIKNDWFGHMFKAGILREYLELFKESKTIVGKIFVGFVAVVLGLVYLIFYLGLLSWIIYFIKIFVIDIL